MADRHSVSQAIEVLRILGSDEDPIRHRRRETTPAALDYLCEEACAEEIRITYWGEHADEHTVGRVHGTLSGLVRERLRTVGSEQEKASARSVWDG